MRNLFQELHQNLPREYPGLDIYTRNALRLIPQLPERPSILDIGCRSGKQTLVLAGETGGNVFAVDSNEAALAELNKKTRAGGTGGTIRTFKSPLTELPFAAESFDLIWSEAAAFAIGFDNALRSWRPLLRPNRQMVISELSWRVPNPPEPARAYWNAAYPAMRTIGGNVAAIEAHGLQLLASFVLPDDGWGKEYYGPLEQRVLQFMTKYRNDGEAMAQLSIQKNEIDLFRAHSNSYGYVFYIMQAAELPPSSTSGDEEPTSS